MTIGIEATLPSRFGCKSAAMMAANLTNSPAIIMARITGSPPSPIDYTTIQPTCQRESALSTDWQQIGARLVGAATIGLGLYVGNLKLPKGNGIGAGLQRIEYKKELYLDLRPNLGIRRNRLRLKFDRIIKVILVIRTPAPNKLTIQTPAIKTVTIPAPRQAKITIQSATKATVIIVTPTAKIITVKTPITGIVKGGL